MSVTAGRRKRGDSGPRGAGSATGASSATPASRSAGAVPVVAAAGARPRQRQRSPSGSRGHGRDRAAAVPRLAPGSARPASFWRLPGSGLRGARLFGAATLALSLLGLVYLVQISHVASYGYLLSDIEERQAQLDREYELLLYQLSGERTLARVGDIAQREYGMQPLDRTVGRGGAVAANGLPATPTPPGGGMKALAPRHRFLSVQRPPATVPPARPTRTSRLGPVDRLWNRVVGIGVASAPEPSTRTEGHGG